MINIDFIVPYKGIEETVTKVFSERPDRSEISYEIIVAPPSGITINAARLCATDDITGSLESGKYADIIAVKENPIENLKTLRDVMFIMKEGKIYKA